MLENGSDIVVAGELFVDLLMSDFDCWPEPGKEVFARTFHREVGGGAMITGCGMAKLGSRVGIFGVAGSDWHGWLTEQLERCGMETTRLRCDATASTAFTVIATGPTDRAFLTYNGANRLFESTFRQAVLNREFKRGRHIHLAYPVQLENAAALFDGIHRNGCTVSLDVGWREEWLSDSRSLEILRHVDIFFPNEVEAARLTGQTDPEKILGAFNDLGVPRVALKLGSRGAALAWDKKTYFVRPYSVSPVDTTGAGDCFNAGFLHGWLQNWAPDTCLRAANFCGALSTEAQGGVAGFPSSAQLLEELAKGKSTCEK